MPFQRNKVTSDVHLLDAVGEGWGDDEAGDSLPRLYIVFYSRYLCGGFIPFAIKNLLNEESGPTKYHQLAFRNSLRGGGIREGSAAFEGKVRKFIAANKAHQRRLFGAYAP
jgi:hypothetical protein